MVGPIKCILIGGILVSVGLIASSLSQNIVLVVLPLGILTGMSIRRENEGNLAQSYGCSSVIEYSRNLIWPRSCFYIKCLMLIFIWYAYKFK